MRDPDDAYGSKHHQTSQERLKLIVDHFVDQLDGLLTWHHKGSSLFGKPAVPVAEIKDILDYERRRLLERFAELLRDK